MSIEYSKKSKKILPYVEVLGYTELTGYKEITK